MVSHDGMGVSRPVQAMQMLCRCLIQLVETVESGGRWFICTQVAAVQADQTPSSDAPFLSFFILFYTPLQLADTMWLQTKQKLAKESPNPLYVKS